MSSRVHRLKAFVKLKTLLAILVSAGIGFGAAVIWMKNRQATRSPPGPQATSVPQPSQVETVAAPETLPTRLTNQPAVAEAPPARRSFQEILDELATIQVTPGP